MRRRAEESTLQQTWRIEILRKSLFVKDRGVLPRQVQPVRQHGAPYMFSYMTKKFRSRSGIKHRFTSKVFSTAATWYHAFVPDLSHLQEQLLVLYCNSDVLLVYISSWDFLDTSREIQLNSASLGMWQILKADKGSRGDWTSLQEENPSTPCSKCMENTPVSKRFFVLS